jgi:lysophospholipase L1-like esterase
VLKPYIDDVNVYILNTATAQNIGCARVYLAFNGPLGTDDPWDKGLLAFDRFHPNDAGHALIAHLLRELGYQSTAP